MRMIGDRVGAILSADDKAVRFCGFGVYVGDEIPKEAAGWIADVARDMGHANPKIQLDSGKVVYGCECWWGSEEEVRRQLAGREIIHVDIDEERDRARSKP